MKLYRNILINLTFRALGVIAKFILMINIAKKLPLNDLGSYNLIASSLGVSVFILGFEFNLFANRELTKSANDNAHSVRILNNSFVFYGLAYIVLLPLLLFYFFGLGFLQVKYLPIFAVLLISDHLSQEICRILAARFHSNYYNFLFFVKNGLWVYVLMGYIFFSKQFIDLDIIFSCWAIFTIVALSIGIEKMIRLRLLKLTGWSFDRKWIANGIRVSLPFFISTIAFRILEINDRFFIQAKLDMAQLGVYAFYIGLASVPYTMVTSAITVQYVPHMVREMESRNQKELNKNIFHFAGVIVLIYAIFAACSTVVLGKLLLYLNKGGLSNDQPLFWILTLATFFLSLQQVGQSLLYAMHKDKLLMLTIAIFSAIDVLLNYLYTAKLGIYTPAYALLITAGLLMVTRILLAIKYMRFYEKD